MDASSTIFALSTPRGRSAIAVLRVSGPAAGSALQALAGGLPPARRARLMTLRAPAGDEILDRALVLWLPGPHSFTGEDMAELHLHGSRAVIEAVLAALAKRPGLVPAEPGAFTARAFRHGRLDLTAVEGLSDLLAAETQAQRRQALRQLDGVLADLVEGWRTALIAVMARIEADIDFPDEGLEDTLVEEALTILTTLRESVAAHLEDTRRGARLRDGFQVALLGPPNVGKSSLLNALARRDVAIVSDEPGTTRDILEVHLDLGGLPVILVDMAGLRNEAGRVEALGIARARSRAAAADLRLVLVEATGDGTPDRASAALMQADDLLVLTKADLVTAVRPTGALAVSAVTGEGLPALLDNIETRAAMLAPGEAPVFTRLRHQQSLTRCRDALDRILQSRMTAAPEIIAEDLRLAAHALGQITGRIDVEDILDTLFAEFCIGK